jgi:hypothetical protein
VFVIRPLSALPALTDMAIIDGRTQSTFAGDTNPFGPEIVLDGNGLFDAGLTIHASGSGVYGLNVQRFAQGLLVESANAVTVAGNYIGTDATGSQDAGNGGGVQIASSSSVTIGGDSEADRNLISGNGTGIWLLLESSENSILGNYVGLDRTGSRRLPNTTGISISTSGPSGTRIHGNVIGGNRGANLRIAAGADGNVLTGNRIGTDAAGAMHQGGIFGIHVSSSNNRIGTDGDGVDDAAEGNLVSSSAYGVFFQGNDARGTVVAGNRIGTNAAGTAALGNATGIRIFDSANNRIGTNGDGINDAAEGNLISGNDIGIMIGGFGASNNVVAGNRIGASDDGVTALHNGRQSNWHERRRPE